MWRAGQGRTSSPVMTDNHMTHPPSLWFVLASARVPVNALGFQKICYLRVLETIIRDLEGLNLVSEEELFIGTVNGTEMLFLVRERPLKLVCRVSCQNTFSIFVSQIEG